MRDWGGTLFAALLMAACSSSPKTQAGSTTSGGGGTTTGPKPALAGAHCTSDAGCISGICGASTVDGGAGNCCARACDKDPLCGATGCDATGACIYPAAETPCGTICNDALLRNRICDGDGVCQLGTGGPCPDNLACADGGEVCNDSCASPLDCTLNFTCADGGCVPRFKTGPCGNNFDCVSGVCGADGTGNCCAAPCNSTVPPCGASECDPITGACLYVDAGMKCGSVVCTKGTQGSPTLCDGLGHCSAVSCAPYLCGPGACQTSCADSLACVPGGFCDLPNSACCAGFDAGTAIAVDGLLGSDATPCCGLGGATPCATLTHAMSFIEAARVGNVTLNATLGPHGGNWPTTGNEKYPIVLGWGVELVAPGITFNSLEISTVPNSAKFSSASVVGTVADPVVVGLNETTSDAIVVGPGNTLYIANARLFSSQASNTAALQVDGEASVVLGQDQSGGVTGTVYIGDPLVMGSVGIECQDDSVSGCTITDAPLQGMSSVVIQNQADIGLLADSSSGTRSVITLTSAPTIGEAPTATGFGKCPAKAGTGIELSGNVDMDFENGAVQCMGDWALELDSYGGGEPSLTVNNTTIQNATIAAQVQGGRLVMANSTVQYNYIGIWDDDTGGVPGTIDLGGVAGKGSNTIVCSSSTEAGSAIWGFPAISVLNTTTTTINADNVSWDTPGPDQFQCNGSGLKCTCEIPMCVNAGGVDGMDAVNTTTGSITTMGNTLSNANCTPP